MIHGHVMNMYEAGGHVTHLLEGYVTEVYQACASSVAHYQNALCSNGHETQETGTGVVYLIN